jgi:hypothetical protein
MKADRNLNRGPEPLAPLLVIEGGAATDLITAGLRGNTDPAWHITPDGVG